MRKHAPNIDILDKLYNLKPTEDWALELILSNDHGAIIKDSIIEETYLAISDGSFKNNRGTSAGIIEKEGVPESRMFILNRVPGMIDDHSSYRSELSGVCGTITAIDKIVEHYKISSGKVKIGLDGQSVIQRFKNPETIKSTMPSQDLLRYVINKVSNSSIDIEFF